MSEREGRKFFFLLQAFLAALFLIAGVALAIEAASGGYGIGLVIVTVMANGPGDPKRTLEAWAIRPLARGQQQSCRSLRDRRGQSRPRLSCECSRMRWLGRYIPAGWCRGSGTACPCHLSTNIARTHPSDFVARHLQRPGWAQAARVRPRSVSTTAILPCGRPWPCHSRLVRLRRQ